MEIGSQITVGLVGFAALAGFIWARFNTVSLKIQIILAMIAGACITGPFIPYAEQAADWVRDSAGWAGSAGFGVSAVGVGFVVGVIVVLELWRSLSKKGKTRSWHPYLALFAPFLLAACLGLSLSGIASSIGGVA
jgi:hypothetical protein